MHPLLNVRDDCPIWRASILLPQTPSQCDEARGEHGESPDLSWACFAALLKMALRVRTRCLEREGVEWGSCRSTLTDVHGIRIRGRPWPLPLL